MGGSRVGPAVGPRGVRFPGAGRCRARRVRTGTVRHHGRRGTRRRPECRVAEPRVLHRPRLPRAVSGCSSTGVGPQSCARHPGVPRTRYTNTSLAAITISSTAIPTNWPGRPESTDGLDARNSTATRHVWWATPTRTSSPGPRPHTAPPNRWRPHFWTGLFDPDTIDDAHWNPMEALTVRHALEHERLRFRRIADREARDIRSRPKACTTCGNELSPWPAPAVPPRFCARTCVPSPTGGAPHVRHTRVSTRVISRRPVPFARTVPSGDP